MEHSEKDLASLNLKIEQIEAQQNITAKYAVGVKRQLDELIEKFNNLQERFEQEVAFSNDLNSTNYTNRLVSSEAVAVASVTDSCESARLNKSTDVMVVTPVAAEVKANTDSEHKNLDEEKVNADVVEFESDDETATAKHEEFSTTFSDEEFKLERMMWLLNRTYADEEESEDTPIDAEEFWRRYNEGERNFTKSNLAGAHLRNVNWSSLNLMGASLKGADLSNEQLHYAKLRGANLDEANLSGANLSQSNLEAAKLKKANLNRANLRNAKLNSADLSNANLSNADLLEANLEGANLKDAKLSGAIMPDGTTHE